MAAAEDKWDCAKVINEDDDVDTFQVRELVVNPGLLANAQEAAAQGIKVRTSAELKASGLFVETKKEAKDNKDGGDDMFAVEERTEQVQFMSVKPWLGMIAAPTNPPKNDPTPPKANLQLEWVYGYRGYDAHSNLVVNSQGQIVYPIAAVVVTYDAKAHTQKHFLGHNNDIICLAQHPTNLDVVATGQTASIVDGRATPPCVCVHNTVTGESWTLKDPKVLMKMVTSVSFSRDGKYVAAVCGDNNQTVSVWDWKTKTCVASEKGDTNPILAVRWGNLAENANEFTTVGVKHVYTWTLAGNKISKKRLSLGNKFALQSFYCVCYSEKGYPVVGARDGSIYVFVKGVCAMVVEKAHRDSIISVEIHADGLLTGGADGRVVNWTKKLAPVATLQFKHAVRSVMPLANGSFVAGTAGNQVYRFDDLKTTTQQVVDQTQPLVKGHFDGEVWGLSNNLANPNLVHTVGEDNTLLTVDLAQHRVVGQGIINPKAGAKVQIKKASTMSKHPTNQCARAIDVSPNGEHMIIGTNAGEVAVYQTADMKQVAFLDLNNTGKRQLQEQTQNWIEAIKYSPDGSMVAVGTHGMVIVLLDVAGGYRVSGVIRDHTSAVTHLDWAETSRRIASVSRGYDLMFHDLSGDAKAIQVVKNMAVAQVKDTQWATQNCIFGWPVQGIFNSNWDGTDVNFVDRSPDNTLLVTGDDFGNVRLFRNPCLQKNQCHSKAGHSSHVTRVKFTPDQKYVVSTGGNDKAIMQWRLV